MWKYTRYSLYIPVLFGCCACNQDQTTAQLIGTALTTVVQTLVALWVGTVV